jgi:osmotically-inducible protein OsmY
MARVKIILGVLSLGALSAALLACGSSDERSVPPGKRPLGIGNTTMANSKLEQAVRDKLNSDEQLKAADIAVSADVTMNQVTLSGAVATELLRDKAVELAKGAQVGVTVSDRIQVKPRASNTEPSSRKRVFA